MSNFCQYPFVGQQFYNQNNNNNDKKDERDCLKDLVGKEVKVNRGGHDCLEGKLLAVRSDYLVLCSNNKIVYINTEHVKSITEVFCDDKSNGNKKDGNKSGGNKNNSGGNRSRGNCCRNKKFIKADNFRGVLKALEQEFVVVNTGGHEKVEGFLAEVCKDTIKIVQNREVVQVLIDHIKSIRKENRSCGSCGNRSGNRNEGSNQGNKSGNKNQSNNQGNKSGGKNQGNRNEGNRSGNQGNRSGNRNRSSKK
ncbi:MAG: hypothetical protein ACE3L7_04765 [Candidatus Pristimantibacillus sp.]